jgi:acetylornithine deacetylase/succinyl-diaminopimelate desuccinylase-like protein
MGWTAVSPEAVEGHALALLEQLCRLPSVSAEDRALPETADLVEEMLRDCGFTTQQLRVGGAPPVVYGEQKGRSSYTLLLYNHYDVQPAESAELWESPPFEPTLRDGKLYARGAADNKGELAVRLAVVQALRTGKRGLPIGIRWVIEGEEEVGSPHFEDIAREYSKLLMADACLWEGASASASDGRPEVTLGVKGMLAVRLEVEALASDAHSGAATVVPSAAWRLIGALSTIRNAEGRVLVPGFYDEIREPTAEARRAVAEQSDAFETGLRRALGIDVFVDDVTGLAFRERTTFAPTCNIAGIASGYAGPGMKTVLPARASAQLDFRLVPDQNPHTIFAQLRSHLERKGYGDVEVTQLGTAEPVATPLDHALVRQVVEVAEHCSGMRPSINPMSGGTLPLLASLRRHVGVPGLSPPDNPFKVGSGAHAPNEHIWLDDLSPAIGFLGALLDALGQDEALRSLDGHS